MTETKTGSVLPERFRKEVPKKEVLNALAVGGRCWIHLRNLKVDSTWRVWLNPEAEIIGCDIFDSAPKTEVEVSRTQDGYAVRLYLSDRTLPRDEITQEFRGYILADTVR